MTDAPDQDFEALLEYLKRARGFDFNAYKPPSLKRRIEKRMQEVAVAGFGNYSDYLEVHPDEFAALFDVILINVTAFFRDAAAWDYLRTEVLPPLLAARPDTEPVRVWSAGCASGEETFSIAMLLADALGRDAFRARVKIYATDADEDALNQGRAAIYSSAQVQNVPADLLGRYFTRDGDRYVFDKEVRRSVIFGRHDLVQDAPISRVHLLICRNALMYFNTEAQTRIVHRFHFALAEHGVLFLGKAEMLFAHTALFAPIDLRSRLFRRVTRDHWRDRAGLVNQPADESAAPGAARPLYPAAFDVNPNAQVVVDAGGALMLFNDGARALFSIAPSDLGRPFQDLELSYRPIELRSHIREALDLRRPVILRDVEGETAAHDRRYFDVQITPLADAGATPIGVSVTFTDVSRVRDLQNQLARSRQDLETAYEELQSTNEELETTNEELQSTVEELETTNEELQSTNEELETLNQELQSANQGMQTANDGLRQRGDDLQDANALLEAILAGVRSSVVVLDCDLRVIAWNRRSEDLWGVRAEEVRGQNFLNLDIGLPTDRLRPAIRACLAGEADKAAFAVAATDRRGKPIACSVTGSPLVGAKRVVRGVILVIDDERVDSPPPAVH